MENVMIQAAKGQRTNVTPIWIEVQMLVTPEHKKLTEKYGFAGIVKNAELAAISTVEPVEKLGVDAAILFSDLLAPAEAMGINVEYSLNGPSITNPVRSLKDVEKLVFPDPEEGMKIWLDTIRISKRELAGKAPIIGWVGAPFGMGSFIVEGGRPAPFRNIKRIMYREPKIIHSLFEKLSEMAIRFLEAQIEAGAEIAMLFDIVAGFLAPEDYREFCYPYIKRIAREIKKKNVPLIYHSRGFNFLKYIKDTEIDVVGIDETIDISDAIEILEGKKTIQGNLEPYVLFAEDKFIKERTEAILDAAAKAPAHIFALGGWILRDTPFEKAKYLVEVVHNYKR
ncbi:MAG: uroporphyrinogen decarboxylase [Candidatus Schekmanbacteria bacterium]|nr:MAG: uroporphyrinogen decarboxylase [Candidatus Schekmanbacteria bacterium]